MNGSRKWSGKRHLSPQPNREDRHMAEGTIKKLTDKGFGFINTGGSKDLFFHSKNLQSVSFDDLYEGQDVTFTEGQGPKGPCAENVRPA
jgi:cold shock protein